MLGITSSDFSPVRMVVGDFNVWTPPTEWDPQPDVVVCSQVIEHVDDPGKFMQKLLASAPTHGFFPSGSGRQRIMVLMVEVCMPEAVAAAPSMAVARWARRGGGQTSQQGQQARVLLATPS